MAENAKISAFLFVYFFYNCQPCILKNIVSKLRNSDTMIRSFVKDNQKMPLRNFVGARNRQYNPFELILINIIAVRISAYRCSDKSRLHAMTQTPDFQHIFLYGTTVCKIFIAANHLAPSESLR